MAYEVKADRNRTTIPELILSIAAQRPGQAALLAVDTSPLSYSRLAEQITLHAAQLRAVIPSETSVAALVLPNGPLMAAAFLSLSRTMACAPLNSGYREEEFLFYLEDLQADFLVTSSLFGPSARAAAGKLGIRILEIETAASAAAGSFSFRCVNTPVTTRLPAVDPDSTALLLHTSGTTSRPKLVPLSHRNLCTSAANIAASLKLDRHDICLNVMPLFHVHGLIGATLSSLVAGAGICCTPGFDPVQFSDWMKRIHPTWWTAVPTMQHAILEQARRERTIPAPGLRFIRSSSAPLPPQILVGLEEAFQVPVIEAYGMTEASHQITTNPLPPQVHKPGSVGIPRGIEVGITARDGSFLPAGQKGEVSLRGSTVTRGYLNTPDANEAAFFNGWFRTGDEGYLDEDGYLVLTSRIKEIINRGGEKIAPREVDEALLSHPEILEALCFSVPHPRLGEDVAAAVVLQTGRNLAANEIRSYTAARLADFKVPSRVYFLDEIPKGNTGKPQRVGFAERAGFCEPEINTNCIPYNTTQKILQSLWAERLGMDTVPIAESFVSLGGDSIQAMLLAGKVQEVFSARLSLIDFFKHDTIELQAAYIDELRVGAEDAGSADL